MKNRNVLISGASVAGPALAYWLGRYGFQPTVVEMAPALRGGGYAVDFRGATHLTVLERMGVLDELRRLQTGGSPMRFVDATGRQLLYLPGEFAGGDVEIRRADLSRVLYERSRDTTEYIFGDTITGLAETAGGVDVTFERAAPRTFDLVVGADGLHSGVRRLAFGPHARFVRYLGYHVAGWELPDYLGLGPEALMYNVPGRLASVAGDHRAGGHSAGGGTAGALFVFASPPLDYDRRDPDQQKKLLADAYAGVGWEAPRLLETLWDAQDLYFDPISRVDIDPWWTGRVALVGDAACGATLGGMGTGTAVVAAYVLAGELARAGGEHRTAFARYDSALRDYARRCQKGGDRAGRFLAPRSAIGLRLRNRLLNSRFLLNAMLRMGREVPSRITLPDLP